MHKSEMSFLVFMIVFMILSVINSFYLWIPASAPPVLLILALGVYSALGVDRGNKA